MTMLEGVVARTFEQILDRTRSMVGERLFDMWFKRIKLESLQRGTLVLGVPSVFARDWIEHNYRAAVEAATEDVLGTRFRVVVEVSAELQRDRRLEVLDAEETMSKIAEQSRPNDPTFENFVETDENRFAYRTVLSEAATNTGRRPAICIHGPRGHGKTHLLRAYIARMRAAGNRRRVLAIDALGFSTRFTLALKNKESARFRDAMLSTDVVCFDEVHRLKGKTATQREFVALLELWQMAGVRMLFAGRHSPRDIHELGDALKSHFLNAIVTPIADYSPESVVRVCDATFAPALRMIDSAVKDRFAGETSGDVGAFRERLARAQALAGMVGRPLTVALVNEHVTHLRGPARSDLQRFDRLMDGICTLFAVKKAEVLSMRKLKSLIEPRGLLICLVRDRLGLTFKNIGRLLGGRSHTSVYLLYRRYSPRIAVRPDVLDLARHLDAPSARAADATS